MTDTYNGWTNRETWALVLHINNDQGWQESVLEDLRTAQAQESEDGPLTTWQAGSVVRQNAETILTVDGYSEMTGEDHLPAELSRIAEDIGSLYRVNWDEVGASFLEGLDD